MSSASVQDNAKLQSMATLDQALAHVAPEAILLDSRIIRRVIRLDRRLKGLGIRVPHEKTYTIDRARLLAFLDHRELSPSIELASKVILLSRPTEQEVEQSRSDELLLRYWRYLFHSRLHLAIESKYASLDERLVRVEERVRQFGHIVFEEIRSVLLKDGLLFNEHSDWEVYVEFLAVSLELNYFASEHLPSFFPAVSDWETVLGIVSRDVKHAELYNASRLLALEEVATESQNSGPLTLRKKLRKIGGSWSNKSTGDMEQLQEKANRFAGVGNHVKAAMYWRMAAQIATGKRASQFRESSLREMGNLVEKLQQAVRDNDTRIDQWLSTLYPALDAAAQSSWSAEARLLFDLQKICVEDESESQRANLLGWLTSLGREPTTRPLPLLKFVLRTKYIRSAQRRLLKSRLTPAESSRIANLLNKAEQSAECLLRDAVRPLIHQQLDRVGLVPANVPEIVARNKLVEELLDNLVEYGYITSGTLRDALSKGDLKLRDVSGKEILFGDQFLLADRYLAEPLDGVYRPAPVYLRWSQRLSSLAFGTRLGRFLTLHTALPFGGAFLLVEGVRHVVAWFGGNTTQTSATTMEPIDPTIPEVTFSDQYAGGQSGVIFIIAWVLTAGVLIYLLMHNTTFRTACTNYSIKALQWIRHVIFELPGRLLRIRLIEQLLYSPTLAPLRTYLIKPGLLTAGVLMATQSILPQADFRNALVIFLTFALLLNSSMGRYADEWLTDQILRAVEDLRARVFGALFQWIMEVFQQLLIGLDRILHILDEWSRFRKRDDQWVKVAKFVSGTAWSVIAYFIVLVSTLLIEPQINPIKHFPVVTVSHKLLLPFGPVFVVWLSPLLGAAQANTLVWSTIWLIPGVFGFLVWELRGNWRLYAANRPAALQSQAVGSHGENMVALLRPSFHSGTLPKLFTRLRRAIRKAWDSGNQKQLVRQQNAIGLTKQQVQRFVERELIELLVQSGTFRRDELSVQTVRLATNCIRVSIVSTSAPEVPCWISWEEVDQRLSGTVKDTGLSSTLTSAQQKSFATALTGLLQRTGAEHVAIDNQPKVAKPMTWDDWIAFWDNKRSGIED